MCVEVKVVLPWYFQIESFLQQRSSLSVKYLRYSSELALEYFVKGNMFGEVLVYKTDQLSK